MEGAARTKVPTRHLRRAPNVAKSILCYGDSITWGYDPKDGSRLPPEDRWPRVLENALQGRATGGRRGAERAHGGDG